MAGRCPCCGARCCAGRPDRGAGAARRYRQGPRAALVETRRWPDELWDAGVQRLVERGFLNEDESFTELGEAFRAEIEQRTNIAALALVEAVGPDQTQRLIELLKPIRRALVNGGAFAALGGDR